MPQQLSKVAPHLQYKIRQTLQLLGCSKPNPSPSHPTPLSPFTPVPHHPSPLPPYIPLTLHPCPTPPLTPPTSGMSVIVLCFWSFQFQSRTMIHSLVKTRAPANNTHTHTHTHTLCSDMSFEPRFKIRHIFSQCAWQFSRSRRRGRDEEPLNKVFSCHYETDSLHSE